MKSNIEAIAIKNLRGLLRERGYTAESLFAKFDVNGDGYLSKSEFETSLRTITGQVAPNAILNAVFGALDADSSGLLELSELISLVETGELNTISEGDAIVVSSHTNEDFNGLYEQQGGQINGKPWYRNSGGRVMYFYNANSGGAPSWSLDDREQDGSNDWYRGGWTRAPSDGSPPLGTRRWVGVGKLTLTKQSSGSPHPPLGKEADATVNQSAELESLFGELDLAVNYFEGQVSEGNFSTDHAMEMANSSFEKMIGDLPLFMQTPARKAWEVKLEEMESRLGEAMPDGTTIAVGAAALGTAGVIAANVRDNISDHSEPVPTVPKPPAPVTDPGPPEPQPLAPVTDPAPPEPQPPAHNIEVGTVVSPPESGLNLAAAVSAFQEARMLSERNNLKGSFAGRSGDIQLRVNSVERTFGIGLSETYRGGSTLLAHVDGVGEVEVRLSANSDASEYKSGSEGNITVAIADWNAVRKRLVLEAQ